MVFLVDLRYVLPPLMNLFIFLLQVNQEKPWNPVAAAAILLINSPNLVSKLILFLLALFLLLFFFYVSFELPITVRPLLLRTRQHFSIALLLSLAASLLFPPSHFWFFFLLIILTYPWHGKILHLFASFLRWLAHTLQSIPIYFIIITRNQENPNQLVPQVEHPNIEIQWNSI